MRPLGIRAIRPTGWLAQQLRIQADGLSGHLDEFWPDVGQSGWFGGQAESWERGPYWLDGVVPLAWLLGDEALQAKVHRYVGHILDNQGDDGWLGPRQAVMGSGEAHAKFDVWALFLALKVLAQYHEVTGEPRVLDAMGRCLKLLDSHLDAEPLYNWGRYRWFEVLVAAYYLYERTGEAWLLDVARKHHSQGFDWRTFYTKEDVTRPTPRRGMWKWAKHVVNTALALKGYALWWRLSGDEADRQFPRVMLEMLDKYHGQVTGMFTGDECLAGKNPVQGTELCAVTDAMYSLELLLSVLGDPAFGDRLERIAFNALPATMSPDMWSHQYDQQANQAQCTVNDEHLWGTNGPDSNIFGLEPNYGCCTANLHQGWPKFAAHLWMRTADDGLAAVAYAPSVAEFETGGATVSVRLDTEYPFRDNLHFTVTVDRPVEFPLLLRIPAWAQGASLTVAGAEVDAPQPGTFCRVQRQWQGETELRLTLPMTPKTSRRYNGAIAIERGPLVYSLKIGEQWRRVNEDQPYRQPPHADWELLPTTPWNYALDVDEQHPEKGLTFTEAPVGDCPFSPDGAPVLATVCGRKLPHWGLRHGWAAETPLSPCSSDEPIEELTLIPYGCTDLRMTELPRLKRE